MKVNLMGPYPPPYGGISIHIKRLYENLIKNQIDIKIYSTNRILEANKNIKFMNIKKCLFKIMLTNHNEIWHIHNSSFKIRCLLGIIAYFFNKNIILTIHGVSLEEEYTKLNKLGKIIYKFFLNKLSYLIVVNPKIKEWCKENNILKNKIKVIPGYINPIINKNDYNKIDECVWNFINENKRKGYKVITGNGNIRFFNNEELYGLDMLIELIYLLKQKKIKVGLIFALLGYDEQTKKEREYFEDLENKISKYDINKEIFIYKVKNTEYYPILEKSDIFIRPTNTDGDAISLREALYFKKPSISSDIVERPKGVILFKTRDIKNLFNKIEYVIKNYQEEVKKLEKIKVKEYYEEVLEVYKKIYRGN